MNASDELPVYIVSGSNWTCEIETDEDDTQFPIEEQMIEAATKGIEVFKGINQNETFQIIDGDTPYVGIVMHVFLKGTDPEKGIFLPSFIPLGNAGFYKDSHRSQKEFIKENKARSRPEKKIKTIKKRKK